MRIFLAMGPGDIVGDHNKHAAGVSGRGETSVTFTQQAIGLLRARGHEALLISSHPRVDSHDEGGIGTRNWPKPLAGRGGLGFHLSQWLYAWKLARAAKRFGAQLAIVDSGTTHWFMLAAFGMPVAVNFHNVRWPHGFEPQGAVARLVRRLDSWFLRTRAVAAMGCSPECAEQARADGAGALPYFGWAGQFSAQGFTPDTPPPDDGLFHVLFVGRVERNKGVFDIVEMAKRLRDMPDVKVRFEICGDGTALAPLRAAVAEAGLEDEVVVQGRMERADLLRAYARCHAVIVPTRGDFTEGMPLVCAEAMLAGRPVITSTLSNALPVIGPAVIEAVPESVPSYVDAIAQLARTPARWQALHEATVGCRAQFLDPSRSYAAAMDALIAHVAGDKPAPLAYGALYGG